MGIQVKVSGDPRRPAEAVDYAPPVAKADDENLQDLVFIAAMLLGVSGMLFKAKGAAWAGLLLCLSGFANIGAAQTNRTNMSMAFAICIAGLIGSSMIPGPPLLPPLSIVPKAL